MWSPSVCLLVCLPIIPSAVRYCLSGLPVDCQMKNITTPDQTSLLLEDLIIWTNYEIEVAAYNGAGRGTFSHKVTEWTLQGGEGKYPGLTPHADFLSFLPPHLSHGGSLVNANHAAWHLTWLDYSNPLFLMIKLRFEQPSFVHIIIFFDLHTL